MDNAGIPPRTLQHKALWDTVSQEEEEEKKKKKTEEGKNISVKEITEIGLFNVFSLSMKPTELNIGGKDAAERCERIC